MFLVACFEVIPKAVAKRGLDCYCIYPGICRNLWSSIYGLILLAVKLMVDVLLLF